MFQPLSKTPLSNLPCFGIEDVGSVSNADVFKKKLEKVTKDGKTPILVCPGMSVVFPIIYYARFAIIVVLL